MLLSSLLNSIDILKTYKNNNFHISGISYHSQKVSRGDIFVCIRGYKTDGHKYLQQAVHNGAKAAIVEEINEEINIPQYLVENSRIALATIATHFYNHPSEKLKMIGISATNGKTTTSYMLNSILETHNYKTGLIGTVNVKIGDTSIPSELTTPESLDLQNFLHEMVERNISHVTMEVSSAAQEMHRVEKVDYDIVTLNNISREHIDTHGSFERYFETKSRLIKNAKENSFAILNLDCPYSRSLINQTKAKTITFSLNDRQGHFYCKNLDLSTGRAKFTVEILKPITTSDEMVISPFEFDIEMAVPGLHSVYNSMVSIIIALLCHVPISTIQETMKSFSGVKRRFEFIHEDEIIIIDDHFANPGNINVTLETLDFMDFKKLHLLYAIRGRRGPDVNQENAETLVKWATKLNIKEIIATKSVSHVTANDVVTNEEVKAFMNVMSKANIHVTLYEELPDAINDTLERALTGDLILLAGCQGMDSGAQVALNQLDTLKSKLREKTITLN